MIKVGNCLIWQAVTPTNMIVNNTMRLVMGFIGSLHSESSLAQGFRQNKTRRPEGRRAFMTPF
jgi:hypothetical protein